MLIGLQNAEKKIGKLTFETIPVVAHNEIHSDHCITVICQLRGLKVIHELFNFTIRNSQTFH